MALTAIASCGEIASLRIISPGKSISGIQIITESVEKHIGDKLVAEEFVLFVEEMLEEEDIQG